MNLLDILLISIWMLEVCSDYEVFPGVYSNLYIKSQGDI